MTYVHEIPYRKTTTAIPGSIQCHLAGAQMCKLRTANIQIHFNCTSQWCFLCRYVKVCTHIQYMVAICFEMWMTNRPKLNMSKTYPNCFLKCSSIMLFMSSHYVGITLKTSNLSLNVLFKYLWYLECSIQFHTRLYDTKYWRDRVDKFGELAVICQNFHYKY